VALPALAAERRAVARLLLAADRAAIDRYHLSAPGHSSKPAAAACGGRTIGRTDRQMPNIVIDPAAHANYGQCQ